QQVDNYRVRVMADRPARSAIDSLLTSNGLPATNALHNQWEQKTLLGRGSGCGRRHRPCAIVQRPTGDEAVRLEAAKRFALELSIQRALQKQSQHNQDQQMLNMRRAQAQLLLSRVYVGGIGSDANEEALRRAFMPFGPMRSLDVGWDPVQQRHKGFAFVEYDLPEAATLAIDSMNGVVLTGRTLRVSRPSNVPQPAQLVEDLVQQGGLQSTVYVCNVHLDLTESELRSVFEAFGPVKYCALVPDPKRPERHKGYGYIQYETNQAATDAMGSMNNFDLGGQLLRVGRAITNPTTLMPGLAAALANQPAKPAAATGTQAAEPGQPPPAQESAAANQQGAAADRQTAGTEQMLEAEPTVRGSEARQVLTQRLQRPSRVVTLRNLVGSASELDDQFQEDVTEECAKFGTVANLVVFAPETGGTVVVFVRFAEPAEAVRAIEGLDGRYFGGRRVGADFYDEQLFESGNYTG
uniref:Poly(U)-binding-splicing factor PUF60 n=2 Tax=Macrostomum lignano TaxID=282301 RepID=A0A1I8HWZ1_9PLAT